MDEIVIVCSSDNKFAFPLTVVLYSALLNLNKNIFVKIFILDAGIEEKIKKEIKHSLIKCSKNFSIEYISYSINNFSELKETEAISKATYLRILLPDLLPPKYSRAIYLDCDMLVIDDLYKIWNISFDDNNLAAGVQDYYFSYLNSGSIDISTIEDYKHNIPYCNAGMILFNLQKFKEEYVSEKIFSYIKTYQPILNDQDGINAVINGRWVLLEPKWNITLSSLHKFLNDTNTELQSIKKNLGVLHYTSKFKPWHLPSNKSDFIYLYHHQWAFQIYYSYMNKAHYSRYYKYSLFKCQLNLLFYSYKLLRKFRFVQ